MFVRKSMSELGRLSPEEMSKATRNGVLIVLDDVRSMHNVGSVFRTADAFGADGIYLCGFTPKPPHRDIHKTALGAEETVPWQYFEKTEDALQSAKNNGYELVAIEQAHGSISLENFRTDNGTDRKIALVFGNEVTGVSDVALKMAGLCIEIPQSGTKHSLNISVSVGVVLWQLIYR